MNILLTGGTGFIGSYLVIALLNEGHFVTILARNRDKVPAFLKMKNVEILQVSMIDYEGTKKALQKKDVVIHVALNYNDNSAYDMLMSDTAPSIFLATEAVKAGVKHFIYTSSIAAVDNVYSLENPPVFPDSKCNVNLSSKQDPQSYYGATKAAVENFLLAIASQTEMRVNIVRPGYTFGNPIVEGAFSQPDKKFPDMIQSAINGEDIEVIKNDGTQFIWAGDLVKIYLALVNSVFNKRTYIGVSKNFTTYEFVAREVIKQSNSTSKLIVNDLGWKVNPIMFDISDTENDLGLAISPFPYLQDHIRFLVKKLTT